MPATLPPEAQKVFQSTTVSVYQWPQTQFDGSIKTFDCVTRPDYAGVIAFLNPETLVLVKQEQPSKPKPFFDIPGGRVDPGEEPEAAALREFREETGYRAGRWLLWERRTWYGLYRFEEHLYVATDLTLDPIPNREDAGEKITVLTTPCAEAVSLCLKHQLRVSSAILAILAMEYDPESQARLQQFLSAA